ncbi:sulfatase [Arenibacter palladensis]|uniref:sulfatase n=1 Tax=Arenibacter palladensis TaxID=237373 RepID=UPI002FD34603
MKKIGIFIIILFSIGILLSIKFFSSPTKVNKPNVLFIAIDDLRPTLGCYGDTIAITPNMDQLAAKGTIFSKAYCQQAVCNPSRSSILTGLRPDQINVTNLVNHFREKMPNLITLPQIFKDNGYESLGLGKIYHGSKKAQDEVSWTKPAILNVSNKAMQYALGENKTGDKAASYENADVEDDKYEDGQIANEAIRNLDHFKKNGKPFFLAVGFKKPHLPFSAPKKYWDLYDPNMFNAISHKEKPTDSPDLAFHDSQELRGYVDIPNNGTIDRDKERKLWQGYYACVTYVDAQLGKIMKSIKDLGLDKNTIVVLWGDHGYHLGEQDLWCKSTNFELDSRIPLIISDPTKSFRTGTKSNALVEAVDIYPTLIDLCDLKTRMELAGRSLKTLLVEPDNEFKEAAFTQFARPYEALFSKDVSHMGYSVRTQNWRCTAWFNAQNDSIEYTELYDLKETDIEKANLSGIAEYGDIELKLLQMLKTYKNQEYNLLD